MPPGYRSPSADEDDGGIDVHVEDHGGRRLVTLVGALDGASAPLVLELATADSADVRELVVDLAGLTFIDSSGLSALIRLRRTRPPFCVRNPGTAVRRVMEVTGLVEYLGCDPAEGEG